MCPNNKVLVFFGNVKPKDAIEALEIDLKATQSPASLILGNNVQTCLRNGHRVVMAGGAGRYVIMDMIYQGLPEVEVDEYVRDPDPAKYPMLKQVFEALGGMLMGEGEEIESKL